MATLQLVKRLLRALNFSKLSEKAIIMGYFK